MKIKEQIHDEIIKNKGRQNPPICFAAKVIKTKTENIHVFPFSSQEEVKPENMTIVTADTWVVKPEKQAEFTKLWKRYLKYFKDNPKLFKEVKWTKTFTQMFGGTYGAYVNLSEYNSLADCEKLNNRTMKDPGLMKLSQEMMLLIDSVTYTSNVWTTLE